jgi:hypothetical protein
MNALKRKIYVRNHAPQKEDDKNTTHYAIKKMNYQGLALTLV